MFEFKERVVVLKNRTKGVSLGILTLIRIIRALLSFSQLKVKKNRVFCILKHYKPK